MERGESTGPSYCGGNWLDLRDRESARYGSAVGAHTPVPSLSAATVGGNLLVVLFLHTRTKSLYLSERQEQQSKLMARSYPWKVTGQFWEKVKSLLPPAPSHAKGGRPRMDDRAAFEVIVYVLRTGIQWNALPRELGASSTVHDRFQE